MLTPSSSLRFRIAASFALLLVLLGVAFGQDQPLKINYRLGMSHPSLHLFEVANDLSGTFSQLDSRHANFNGGCVFMYVVNHKQDPVSLSIDAPKSWRIVNGGTESKDKTEFQFPNWDILIDTPTEIAPDWTEDDFKVEGKRYRVVVHSLGNEGGKRPALVRDIERVVRTETATCGP